jgi:hypothetical protein
MDTAGIGGYILLTGNRTGYDRISDVIDCNGKTALRAAIT